MALNSDRAALGVTIIQTLSLALPAACNVKTPPISKCNGKELNLKLGLCQIVFVVSNTIHLNWLKNTTHMP